MGKALGIVSFVLLLISIPVPIFGIWLAFFALLLGGGAGLLGEKTWAFVSSIFGFVVLLLLSPVWHLVMFPVKVEAGLLPGLNEQTASNGGIALTATVFAVALPIIGLIGRRMVGLPGRD